MRSLRMYAMLAAILLTCFASAAQNGDEIIQKHIDAIGGVDNWAKISSMKLTGSISMGGIEISMTQTVVNDKGMRMDISAMGINGYTIITPKEGWIYMPLQPGMDQVTPMPAEELQSSRDKINVRNMLLADKSKIATSEYVGMDTIDKTACYKVKVTDKEGNAQMAFIDAATFYMLRSETRVKVQGDEQEIGVNFSDFRKQPEGITIPMVWGSPQGDVTFKSVELNKVYAESIFRPDTVEKNK